MSLRDFGPNELMFLLLATRWTILLAVITFVGGGMLGLAVAAIRVAPARPLRWLAAGYIQFFMGTPILIQLFMAYYGSSFLGYRPDPWVAAAVTFSLNGGAFFGEIFRGAIEAIPKGQWEAAAALPLSPAAQLRHVILPQAFRIAIPPTVGFLVQLIKGTSLASIIGFVELTRAAQVINNATFRPFTIFALVALVYYIICRPLSAYSKRMEQKLLVSAR